MYMCVCEFVQVQVPAEGRSIGSAGVEAAGSCEPPSVGAGNRITVLEEQQVLLIFWPSLQPCLFQSGFILLPK